MKIVKNFRELYEAINIIYRSLRKIVIRQTSLQSFENYRHR